MARRGKKGLSADDRELWNRVTQSATPLDRSRLRPGLPETPGAKPPPQPKPKSSDPAGDRLQSFRVGEKATQVAHPPQPVRDLSARLAQAPVRMDHGTHRKMLRGKLSPEARIDLHGMTLAQAHPVLMRFILEAHASGKRLVLVITGKGKDRDEGGPIPVRRGILRHQVPGWLHAPPLGALVLEIREAHLRHGGGGAYYVYLRKGR
ncbi:MAG: Smr/MutS family protein [Roseicyclus sp.]|nr:Smr/MutS family protein [Roseicyclus sp.]